MDKFYQAKIINNHKLNPTTAIISFTLPESFVLPQAGQFYMLQVSRGIDPLLKRPLSIFSVRDGNIHFLYRIVGRGTECLCRFTSGEMLELLGPLGNPYPVPNDRIIAVAGGTGIASLHGLLERYPQRAYLFYGTKNKEEMIIRDLIQELSYQSVFTTDDGSYGIKGNVVDALVKSDLPRLPVYACGPRPMLYAISEWARQKGLPCYVSLEEYMACGIGACLSCVVKTDAGLKSICKDGPVFNIEEIIW